MTVEENEVTPGNEKKSISKDAVKINSSNLKNGKASGSVVITDPEKEFPKTTQYLKAASAGIAVTAVVNGGIDIYLGLSTLSIAKDMWCNPWNSWSTAAFSRTAESIPSIEGNLLSIEGASDISKGKAVIGIGLAIAAVTFGVAVLSEYNHDQNKNNPKKP